MYAKSTLIFEMLKTACALYELRHQGPNKVCEMLERFSNANGDTAENNVIDDWPEAASVMAKAYLEFVYNGAAEPDWIVKAEAEEAK